MRCAIVKDGIVLNVIVWDPTRQPDYKPDEGELFLIPDELQVEPGYTFDGEVYARRQPTAEEIELNLRFTKDTYIGYVNADFQRFQASMFVDAATRDKMRTTALDGVQAIRDAADVDAVVAGYQQVLGQLQALNKEVSV